MSKSPIRKGKWVVSRSYINGWIKATKLQLELIEEYKSKKKDMIRIYKPNRIIWDAFISRKRRGTNIRILDIEYPVFYWLPRTKQLVALTLSRKHTVYNQWGSMTSRIGDTWGVEITSFVPPEWEKISQKYSIDIHDEIELDKIQIKTLADEINKYRDHIKQLNTDKKNREYALALDFCKELEEIHNDNGEKKEV